ncbi:hypothetical protein B0H11DRAFT_1976119 [Mycena galericulata]|nr:hypothetical protein B0H11DRAFT_1976119 [Mycena galericulata]
MDLCSLFPLPGYTSLLLLAACQVIVAKHLIFYQQCIDGTKLLLLPASGLISVSKRPLVPASQQLLPTVHSFAIRMSIRSSRHRQNRCASPDSYSTSFELA